MEFNDEDNLPANKIDLLPVFFLFQFGLMFPFCLLLNSQYPIIISTFILFLIGFIHKKIKLNFKVIILCFIPLSVLLVKLIISGSDRDLCLHYLISFLTIGLAGTLLGSISFSYRSFFYYAYKVSWINLFIILPIPFLSAYGNTISYMRVGYILLPSALFGAYFFLKKFDFSSFLLFTLSFTEMFVFGARGATASLFIFILIYVLTASNFKNKIFIFVFIVIGFFSVSSLSLVSETLTDHGLASYALKKYINISGNNFASTTSGRDIIYTSGYLKILESPIFGSPLDTCLKDTGLMYYHNIFLDLLVNFGVIIFTVFIAFIVFYSVKAFQSKNPLFKVLFMIFFCVSVSRLMISSSFWERPEFWFFLSFCVHSHKTKHFNMGMRLVPKRHNFVVDR